VVTIPVGEREDVAGAKSGVDVEQAGHGEPLKIVAGSRGTRRRFL
jgi:hypothetical protein